MGRPQGGLGTGGLGASGQPCDGLRTCPSTAQRLRVPRGLRATSGTRDRGSADQGRCGAAGGAAAHQPEAHLEQDLSSSGCLEEAVQQPDRRNRRDALRGQVARDHLGHLPTREAASSTQCEAGVRDCAGASSGSRQPEFTRRPPHPRCGMSSSPTLGIGGEAARSESQQGGPKGAPRISARCISRGAEARLVRLGETSPSPGVPTLGPRL